jgi:ABC-type sulfate transport system permease component
MESPWATDDDVENEFRYWVRELLAALKRGTACAVVTAVLIALLPSANASAEAAFARDFWPYLAEAAFWSGMLASMLWSAARRAIGVLTGVPPWAKDDRLRPLPRRP